MTRLALFLALALPGCATLQERAPSVCGALSAWDYARAATGLRYSDRLGDLAEARRTLCQIIRLADEPE